MQILIRWLDPGVGRLALLPGEEGCCWHGWRLVPEAAHSSGLRVNLHVIINERPASALVQYFNASVPGPTKSYALFGCNVARGLGNITVGIYRAPESHQ